MDSEIQIFKEMTEELSSKFHYTPDKEQWNTEEDWRIIEPKDDGILYGDCDDFALYLWYYLKDLHGISSRLIFCEIPTREGYGGHLIIESNGYLADCNHWSIFTKSQVPNWKWVKISDEYMSQDGWRLLK